MAQGKASPSSRLVALNVGGAKFTTSLHTLTRVRSGLAAAFWSAQAATGCLQSPRAAASAPTRFRVPQQRAISSSKPSVMVAKCAAKWRRLSAACTAQPARIAVSESALHCLQPVCTSQRASRPSKQHFGTGHKPAGALETCQSAADVHCGPAAPAAGDTDEQSLWRRSQTPCWRPCLAAVCQMLVMRR